jgi:hypothetical protein
MSLPKTSKLIIWAISLIFCVFIFTITFANFSAFDEQLSDDVKAVLEPRNQLDKSNNAFYAIWGLTAANEKDFMVSGQKLVERYLENKNKTGSEALTDNDYLDIMGGNDFDIQWLETVENCTARRSLKCTEHLAERIKNQPLESERLAVLLQRYSEILDLNDYQSLDNYTFTSPLPPYGVIMRVRQVYLAKALLLESPDAVINALGKDISFWRMMLREGDSLIDKMIAIASLWSNTQAVSDYVRKPSNLSEKQLISLERLLIPLSNEERDISEAFLFEEKAFYNTLISLDSDELASLSDSASPVFWFLLPNATVNDYHQFFVNKLQELNKMSANEFAQVIRPTDNQQEHCCFEEIESLISFSPKTLYNIGGKLLLSSIVFNAQDYIARVHDLDGVISLVRLQLALKKTDMSASQFIEQSTIRAPYGEAPINLNKDKQQLSFECLAKGSLCEIKIAAAQ